MNKNNRTAVGTRRRALSLPGGVGSRAISCKRLLLRPRQFSSRGGGDHAAMLRLSAAELLRLNMPLYGDFAD